MAGAALIAGCHRVMFSIMGKLAPTLLLITSILACPVNCLGSPAHEDAPQASPTGCSSCSCEQSDGTSAPADFPNHPDDDCTSGSCFCRGAVVEAGRTAKDIDHAGVSFDATALSAESTPAVSVLFECSLTLPTSRLAGRYLRIFYQSFLL